MKTGILITARLGSTRLKRKHLLEVNGHPLELYLIKRIQSEFADEIKDRNVELIIATTDELENREFEAFCEHGVAVFYGSINNIPLRHLQAARTHVLDNIVSIDGDDILCSIKGMRRVYEALAKGTNYVNTINLPFGMNSSGYTSAFLESSLAGYDRDTLETGWGRIFNPKELVSIDIPFGVQDDLLRFTLDYDEDYLFFKALIETLGERVYTVSDKEVIDLVMNKELYKITEPVARQYWDNFYRSMEEEKKSSSTVNQNKA